MSWDILVMDLVAISSTADIPDDWTGRPRASRDEVIATIRAAVPRADFSYPARGQSEERGYSVEVNLGDNDPVMSFALHVRGSDAPAAV